MRSLKWIKIRLESKAFQKQKDEVYKTAMVYNLKKLLKFNRKSPKIIAQAMPKNESRLGKLLFFLKHQFLSPTLQF